MNKDKTVTVSFPLDRDFYNLFKSTVYKDGKTVKEALIDYMKYIIENNEKEN